MCEDLIVRIQGGKVKAGMEKKVRLGKCKYQGCFELEPYWRSLELLSSEVFLVFLF
jgi:hypothetical protein